MIESRHKNKAAGRSDSAHKSFGQDFMQLHSRYRLTALYLNNELQLSGYTLARYMCLACIDGNQEPVLEVPKGSNFLESLVYSLNDTVPLRGDILDITNAP